MNLKKMKHSTARSKILGPFTIIIGNNRECSYDVTAGRKGHHPCTMVQYIQVSIYLF